MQSRQTIRVGNLVREYLIYIPDELPQHTLLPVVISLHGTLGSAEQMMGFADFRPIAEREKFLIVCPEGITQTWNDGRNTKAHAAGIDDVSFIDQLITHLINTYPADAKRIYVTGMSNGGFMASRLACELPHRIAAMAAVAATLDKTTGIHPVKPLPVMYIHGTGDRMVPYLGGPTKAAGGNVYSHEEIVKLWAETDGCNKVGVSEIPDRANDGTSIIKKEFINPDTGLRVESYIIKNGGHTWPSGPQYAARNFVGLVSHNLDGCAVIWDFFKSYSL
jgi:polyhydroxybutyrate depolymerase